MDTSRSLYEIEVAIAKSDEFSYKRNIVAFNVMGISENLKLYHECDILVLSKAGYLTEIEIKRSWADFLADFKKPHRIKEVPDRIIKYFYYCLPESFLNRAYSELEERKINYSGIVTYDENLIISVHGCRFNRTNSMFQGDKCSYGKRAMHPHRKLFLEERLELARLASMRAIMLREKLIERMS